MSRIEKHRQSIKDKGYKVVECHLTRQNAHKLELYARAMGTSRLTQLNQLVNHILESDAFMSYYRPVVMKHLEREDEAQRLAKVLCQHKEFTDYT